MAAIVRSTGKLLCRNQPKIYPASWLIQRRNEVTNQGTHSKIPVKIITEKSQANPEWRQMKYNIMSVEKYIQERKGIRKVLSPEELAAIPETDMDDGDSELLQEYFEIVRGNKDAYDMSAVELDEETTKAIGRGTYDDPVTLPCSDQGWRHVTCFCPDLEGDTFIMKMFEGHRRSCNCGIWFQLVDYQKLQNDARIEELTELVGEEAVENILANPAIQEAMLAEDVHVSVDLEPIADN